MTEKTLYISRRLLNAADVIAYFKDKGFGVLVEPEQMHVTLAFSRVPVDWATVPPTFDTLTIPDSDRREVIPLGDKGAVVLRFDAPQLVMRHQAICDCGAVWEFPEFKPHVTLTYKGGDVDLTKVAPYNGALEFGPEVFAEVNEGWSASVVEKLFGPYARKESPMSVDPQHELKRASFSVDIKQIDTEGDFVTFEGFASTFGNEDRGGDVIMQGAFAETIRELTANARVIPGMPSARKLLPILFSHDMSMPLGSFVEMRETAEGLFVRGVMPTSDTFVMGRVVPQMQAAGLADMSIGYFAREFDFVEEGRVRRLTKVDLIETSLVSIPMNPQARITAMKDGQLTFIDLNGELTVRQIEAALRDGARLSQSAAKKIAPMLAKADNHRDGDEDAHREGDEKAAQAGDMLDRLNKLFDT